MEIEKLNTTEFVNCMYLTKDGFGIINGYVTKITPKFFTLTTGGREVKIRKTNVIKIQKR